MSENHQMEYEVRIRRSAWPVEYFEIFQDVNVAMGYCDGHARKALDYTSRDGVLYASHGEYQYTIIKRTVIPF